MNRRKESMMISGASELSGRGKMEPYDSIVIIGNAHYREILNRLSGPKVKVLAEEELNPSTIIDVVRRENERNVGKTLWMLTTGLYSICDGDSHPECKSCRVPLHYLYAGSHLSEAEISYEVQDILFHTNKVCTAIQTELSEGNSNIVIVPPIPAVVVQEAAFQNHVQLHMMCQKYSTSCASDLVLFRLHIFYNILCDAWSSLATEWLPFGEQFLFKEFQKAYRGRNLVSIKNEDLYDYVEQGWITMMNKLIRLAGVHTLTREPEVGAYSSAKEPLTHKGPPLDSEVKDALCEIGEDIDGRPGRFSHCVIVGSSNFFGQLREMVEHMPVSFLERSMDLDEEGLETLKSEMKNYPDNTVWIIVRGVSEIAELTDVSPKCAASNCEDPLFVFVLKNKPGAHPDFKDLSVSEMIEKVLARAVEFAMRASQYLHGSSQVFLAPIIPVSAYYGGTSSMLSHEKLHEIADKNPSTPILAGSSKEWITATQDFDWKWMEMIMKNLNKGSAEHRILKKQVKGVSNLLMFTYASGKNARLLSAQTIWGNAVKGLISVFLGLKDVKDKDVSSSSPAAPIRTPVAADESACQEEPTDKSVCQEEPTTEKLSKSTLSLKELSEATIACDSACAKSTLKEGLSSIESEKDPKVSEYSQRCGGPAGPSDVSGVPRQPENYSSFQSKGLSSYPETGRLTDISKVSKTLGNQDPFALSGASVSQHRNMYGYPRINAPSLMSIVPDIVGNQAKARRQSHEKSVPVGITNKQNLPHKSQETENLGKKPVMYFGYKSSDVELCKVIVNSINAEIKREHITKVLEACGSVVNTEFPVAKTTGRLGQVKVQYNNAKSAKRAARILNFLKVLGKNSRAQVVGSKDTTPIRELHAEDRLIIPVIQDVIVQMQKAKVPTTQVSIVAKKQLVPLTAVAEDTTKPKESKVEADVKDTKKATEKVVSADKPTISVFVSNLSEHVPIDVLKEVVKALGSIGEGDVKQGQFSCQLQDVSEAIRMVILMNNYRLPDTKLKVKPQDNLDFKSAHVTADEELKDQVNMIFKQYNDVIVNSLREVLSKDVNYFTYKTQLCKSIKCKNQHLCHNYHSINDRRRSPITSVYSSSSCGLAEFGACKEREACSLSHTNVEVRFHQVNFRNNLCRRAVKTGSCRYNNGICSDVHPETPEMFFHRSWENLFLEGLGETFKYLNGAIKNMFKLRNTTDLQVLVLTPTDEVVQLLVKTVQNIGKSCRQNVVSVSRYGSVASEGTVMIATPVGLGKLLKRREQAYDFTKIKAIIIDDGLKAFTAIMNVKDDKLTGILSKEDANKVVVDDAISDGRVGIAANVMKASFKKLPLDRPKKKWEPLEGTDISEKKQEESHARPSVHEETREEPAKEKSEGVFKVPALPVPRPKTKESSNASKVKDTRLEITEKSTDDSRPDGKMSLSQEDGNSDTGKVNDALKLIMASYKDFQKGGTNKEPSSGTNKEPSSGTNREPSNKMAHSRESSREKKEQWGLDDKAAYVSPHPDKLNKNLVPYYSLKNEKKKYAMIPFNYGEGDNTSTPQDSSQEEEEENNSYTLSEGEGLSVFSAIKFLKGNQNKKFPDKASSSRDSRRSPTSSRRMRRSPLKDSQKSLQPHSRDSKKSPQPPSRSSRRSPPSSTRDSYSRRKRSPSPYSRSRGDDKGSYIEAEMDLKDDHVKESKLFLDVPEVHPEFENKYSLFSERYEKQYPGKSDSSHKEQRWKEFWKVVVTGMQEGAWKEKVEMLKRQFKVSEPNKKDDKDARAPYKRRASDSKEDSGSGRKFSRKEREEEAKSHKGNQSRERRSHGSSKQDDLGQNKRSSPSSRYDRPSQDKEKVSKGQNKSTKYSEGFSVSHALSAIREVNNQLGVLSPAMKIVIDRISETGVDSKESLNIITENDNALLIELAWKKFESLIKTAPRGLERKKLIVAAAEARKLQEYAALKLQEVAIAAADNAVSLHKGSAAADRKYSSNSAVQQFPGDVKKPSASSEERKIVRGLDVNKIARATHEKGTEATIEFIKNAFAYEGITNPVASDFNEVYIEVSRIHFQMTLNGVSSESEKQNTESSVLSGLNPNTSYPVLQPDTLRDGSAPGFSPESSQRREASPYPAVSSYGDNGNRSFSTGSLSRGENKSPYSNPGSNASSSFSSDAKCSMLKDEKPFPPGPLIENANPSFHTGSSFQSNFSSDGAFRDSSQQQQFPHGSHSYRDNSSHDTSQVPRENQGPAFQHHMYLNREQGHQSNSSSDTGNPARGGSEDKFQQWGNINNDKGTIDFMNERLDMLLQDTRLRVAKENSDQSSREKQLGRSEQQYGQQKGYTEHHDEQQYAQQKGYIEHHDSGERNFDQDGRQYNRSDYGMNQQYGGNDQRNVYFDRENYHSDTRRFDGNQQFCESGPWDRSEGKYGEDSRGDTRNMLNRNTREEEPEIDINSMRKRDTFPPRPQTIPPNPRGAAPGNEWAGPSGNLMLPRNQPGPSFDQPRNQSGPSFDQPRNQPGPSFDHSSDKKGVSKLKLKADASSIQKFLNQFL